MPTALSGAVAPAARPGAWRRPCPARRPGSVAVAHKGIRGDHLRAVPRGQVAAAAAPSGGGAVALRQDAFEALQGCQVFLAGAAAPVDITSLWSEEERVVLVFGRSMGELAVQVNRDLLPALRAKGVKLFFVSIGTAERGLLFCERTGLPPELLLCDPENATYSALDFKKGVRETFFSYETPLAMWRRIKSGNVEDLKQVLSVWTKQELWIPPKQDQAFQQGGAVVFGGRRLLFAHYDVATSAHVDLQLLLDEATRGL